MRWVVGDLQGCAREFDRLLRQIRFDPACDELWSVGDVINRGPESLEALRLWIDTGGKGVIGNHEIYALLARSGAIERKKDDTLGPLLAAHDADALYDRLRALPVLVHLRARDAGPDAWLVHAGLHPQWTDLHALSAKVNAEPHDDEWLESDEVAFATRVRCCKPNGERHRFNGGPAGCPEGFVPWDTLYRGSTLVVHGHWAMRGYFRSERALGLDSGCVYGGPLTAWSQEEDRVVQVPAVHRK